MSQENPLPESIHKIFCNAEETRTLSPKARHCLRSAIMGKHLTEEERHIINLILYSVRLGRLSID